METMLLPHLPSTVLVALLAEVAAITMLTVISDTQLSCVSTTDEMCDPQGSIWQKYAGHRNTTSKEFDTSSPTANTITNKMRLANAMSKSISMRLSPNQLNKSNNKVGEGGNCLDITGYCLCQS